jgi:hypothetical protein
MRIDDDCAGLSFIESFVYFDLGITEPVDGVEPDEHQYDKHRMAKTSGEHPNQKSSFRYWKS